MFRHCIFCKADLGGNEVIEEFPTGKRLAFDSAQGRLWVVCKGCNRWNLTPLEERWEAIERCEQLFQDTQTRLSTENIGLARLREGMDLIRIGQPQRPEFAAWRYGPGLRRRRAKALVVSGAVIAASAGLVLATPALIGLGTGGPLLFQVPNWYRSLRSMMHVVVKFPVGENDELRLKHKHVLQARLDAEKYGWALKLPHTRGFAELRNEDAIRAAALLMPHINRYGASQGQVESAVSVIERTPVAQAFFDEAARLLSYRQAALARAPAEIRLALEMISHENQERRALEGELHELEAMWRAAEEIARISDNLLIPRTITDFLRRQKEER